MERCRIVLLFYNTSCTLPKRKVVQSVSVKWILSISNVMVPFGHRHAKFERNGALVIQILKRSHQILEDLKRSKWKCACVEVHQKYFQVIFQVFATTKKNDHDHQLSSQKFGHGPPPTLISQFYNSRVMGAIKKMTNR